MRTDIKTMQPTASDVSTAKCYVARAVEAEATRPTNDASKNKRESYTVPKESEELQNAADARIKKALDQVPHAGHSNKHTKRSEATALRYILVI
jgi:hypothetical protein